MLTCLAVSNKAELIIEVLDVPLVVVLYMDRGSADFNGLRLDSSSTYTHLHCRTPIGSHTLPVRRRSPYGVIVSVDVKKVPIWDRSFNG